MNISDRSYIRLGHVSSIPSFHTLRMTNQPICSPIDIIRDVGVEAEADAVSQTSRFRIRGWDSY